MKLQMIWIWEKRRMRTIVHISQKFNYILTSEMHSFQFPSHQCSILVLKIYFFDLRGFLAPHTSIRAVGHPQGDRKRRTALPLGGAILRSSASNSLWSSPSSTPPFHGNSWAAAGANLTHCSDSNWMSNSIAFRRPLHFGFLHFLALYW